MKNKFALIISVCIFTMILSSCDIRNNDITEAFSEECTQNQTEDTATNTSDREAVTENVSSDENELNDEDYAAKIIMNGLNVSVSGKGATSKDCVITISDGGIYYFSGNLDNGRIIVSSESEEKTKLVFDGINITCSYGSAVYVENVGDKLEILVNDGTENTLTDGKTYSYVLGDVDEDACIYSKDDIKISGKGTLNIIGNQEKGIHTKNDFKFEKANLNIESSCEGIVGNDSVTIESGNVTITSGGDGIQTRNTEDFEKGNININGGFITITSVLDGMQASTCLNVAGGNIRLNTGGGSLNSSTSSNAGTPGGWGMWSGGGPRKDEGNKSKSEESAKGFKAEKDINITGGVIDIDASDDSVHCNGTLSVSGVYMHLASGDDGMHADDTLIITDGVIDITKSYEGIEAAVIDLRGGTVSIVASDDGMNAAGGVDASSTRNPGRPGGGMFSSDTGTIKISGGNYTINASGDGIDSNGNISMTGGNVVVFGPTSNGDAPVDWGDGNCTCIVSGGTLMAFGSRGMQQNVSSGSQATIAVTMSGSANKTLVIKDSADIEVLNQTPPKSYECLIFCSDKLVSGNTYHFILNGTEIGAVSAS